MINRLQQAFSKFIFCFHVAQNPGTFWQLIKNSKRFSRFQKREMVTGLQKQAAPVQYKINYRKKRNDIYLRTFAGDIKMFYDIFWEEVYRLPVLLHDNSVIIDAGANIGMAALYFNNRFPTAKIYCIEPSAGNVRLLKMNLDTQIRGGKVDVLEAALHTRDGFIGISDKGWAYNSHVADAGDELVPSINLKTFLKNNEIEKVDLLKVDVEGAEEFIFFSDTAWLQKVDLILIEIHSLEMQDKIKSLLLTSGFYWYEWRWSESSGNLFLCSRAMINAD